MKKEELIQDIEEQKERLIGALCNAGYCKEMKEANEEVSDFMDKIVECSGLNKTSEAQGR